jgi:hypothetical protein
MPLRDRALMFCGSVRTGNDFSDGVVSFRIAGQSLAHGLRTFRDTFRKPDRSQAG